MNNSLLLAAALAAGGFAFAVNAQAAQPDASQQPKSLVEFFNAKSAKEPTKPVVEQQVKKKPVAKTVRATTSEQANRVSKQSKTAKVSTAANTKSAKAAGKSVQSKKGARRIRVVIDPRASAPLRPAGQNVASLKTDLKLSSSASAYNPIISRYASQYGVPVSLAHAVIRVESNYRPTALGGAGEIGLMQIKPATARMMGYSGSAKGLYNPETNIRYGMKYLAMAHKLGGGDTCGTILRYNAGHGATRMNPISAAYCGKVKAHLGR